MKKLLLSTVLLIISIVYLITSLSKKTLHVSSMSMDVENPIHFHPLFLRINLNISDSQPAYYDITLIPVYLLIAVSLLLVSLVVKQNKSN